MPEIPAAEPASGELRQGSLCSIESFPRWHIEHVAHVTTASGSRWVQLPDEGGGGHIASSSNGPVVCVCSHDCELENPRGRAGILLAPVIPVPARPGDERFDLIIASAFQENGVWDFIHYFPLEVAGGSECEGTWVVDFSAISSAGPARQMVPLLESARMCALSPEGREAFREKLAAFLGRPSDG